MTKTERIKQISNDVARTKDALTKYYKDVESTSLLTAEAERVLILEYHNTKNARARDKIIQGALRYVISEARKHPKALQDKGVLEDIKGRAIF